jgi:hypothetical protein
MAINPLQAPINYMGMIPQVNLGQEFAEFGQALAQRQERIKKQEFQKQYSQDLQSALATPTQKTWSDMIAKYPQQREAFAEARKGYGEERLDHEVKQAMGVSAAFENKNPEVAKAGLQKIIEAKKNSGEPTQIYQQAFDALEAGNVTGAQAIVNMALATADPDRFQKMVEAQTKAKQAPSMVSKSIADADKAVADATTAQATATNASEKAAADAQKARADADKAKVDSKYAEQITLADIKKKAADLGLTQAQTGSALAQTKKLGLESKKAALELEALKATGGADPAKNFEQEEKIRREWQARNKVYNELGGIYSNLKASADVKTGPGDIALITGFMKMLDPGSVVRETEFATARDTTGLYDRLLNQSQKLQSGQLFALNSKQRNEYVTLSKKYLDAAEEKAKQEKKSLGVVVKNYRLNPENVFGVETTPPAGGGRGAVNPPPAIEPAPAPSGQRNITVDY